MNLRRAWHTRRAVERDQAARSDAWWTGYAAGWHAAQLERPAAHAVYQPGRARTRRHTTERRHG